jgi:hypothetical protein
MKKHLETAIGNFARFGDTDVFPYPMEKYVFFDRFEDTLAVFEEVHRDFKESLTRLPVIHDGSLVAVNYHSYRWATQIDPLWHTYLLALVVAIGEEIESARIPLDREVVYSYRFDPDPETHKLYRRDTGWSQFQERSLELADTLDHVLVCDISDFYPRVYHHSLENALLSATRNKEAVRRIMKILGELSGHRSYGLPVGGDAARLLGELVLNSVDRLLLAEGITFCRFVDDYHLFAHSKQEAYRHLVLLNETLLRTEGLTLQKAKTRLMSAAEFRSTSELSPENELDDEGARERSFLSLPIHFRLYSETAEEDYEAAKEAVKQYNIREMLDKELAKSRIERRRASQLVTAIKLMDEPAARAQTVLTLLNNFQKLYPVFPTVMIVLKAVVDELDEGARTRVFEGLRELVKEGSHIVQIPVNLAYLVRVLAHDLAPETDSVLNGVYRTTSSMMLRRDVILAMARRNADFWVRDRKDYFSTLSPWERRAMLIASYVLGEAGRFFRSRIKDDLSPLDRVVRDWAAEKRMSGHWELPL